jgi:hypothetical protein
LIDEKDPEEFLEDAVKQINSIKGRIVKMKYL